jgi:hypothetical protein
VIERSKYSPYDLRHCWRSAGNSAPLGGGLEARRQGSDQHPTRVSPSSLLATELAVTPRPNIAGGHVLILIIGRLIPTAVGVVARGSYVLSESEDIDLK